MAPAGTSPGVCALRAAIAEANALDGVDTVELPRGTFELTRERQGTASNDEGDLDLTEAIVIEGKGERKTTIEQTVKDRVVLSNAQPESLLPGAVLNNEVNVYEDDSCLDATLSSNLVADPKLKPLAANPGPTPGPVTKTHSLRASSPAVDFVTSGCPPPTNDQVGWPRPQGSACDAGSFERD